MSIRLFKTPHFIFVALFVVCTTQGAVVIEYDPLSETIIASNSFSEAINTGTNVCVYRDKTRTACGKIVQATPNAVQILVDEHMQTVDAHAYDVKRKTNYFVELKFINAPIFDGDCVDVKILGNQRPPCSIEGHKISQYVPPVQPVQNEIPPVYIEEKPREPSIKVESVYGATAPENLPEKQELTEEEKKRETAAIAEKVETKIPVPAHSNLSLGINYIFPQLHFEYKMSEHFSLGINSLLVNYQTSIGNNLKGYGGLLTLNFYSSELFDGIWMQTALGIFQMNASNSISTEQLTLPGGSVLLGWHWKWDSGLNFGLGAGGQYILNAKPSNFDLGFSGFWPAAVLEIGFCL